MIADPPLEVGAAQVRVAFLSPPATTMLSGENGTRAGVAEAKVPHAPSPADVMAAIRNVYVVPFVNPLTVYEVPDASRVNVVQLIPSTEYSMRYESTANPPFDVGAAHTRATWLSLAVADVGRTADATDIGVAFTTVAVALPEAFVGVIRM